MSHPEKPIDNLLVELKERAKELNCLYEVEELFSKPDITLPGILQGIVRAIPPGWQYPDLCQAKITLGSQTFESQNWKETPWMQTADLIVQDEVVGHIQVAYTEEMPPADEGPFLRGERKLINTIADRLERRILHERMKNVFEKHEVAEQRSQSSVIIDLLKNTDAKLLTRIVRKMLNFLSWSGIQEVDKLVSRPPDERGEPQHDINRPLEREKTGDLLALSDEIFRIAAKHLGEEQVLNSIQEWIVEDRSNFLMKILEDMGTSVAEIINAIERFQHRTSQMMELPPARERALRVAMIRRLLSDDPQYIQIAKNFLEPDDFHELWRHIISPTGSHGKVGGKGAGLFLAKQILRKSSQADELIRSIKVPKTWYLTSDGILNFINYNDLEEIMEQKYEDITQVRQEYPYIVHIFKNSTLPPELMNGLSAALDDLGESPLIVRSSSLLEDRLGTSFAGKYKTLFIANQGAKRERLLALVDAVTEVYASTFSPDAIQYRAEHGMIDSHEEMGILIQEVVGTNIGDYFLPAFSGVAFSTNEFRWSHRIRREDGLVRIVPGLGTRAVDRISDDYPILLAPGQPNLRVNVTLEERIWYSPRKIDLLNLKTNAFETIAITDLLKTAGDQYPMISRLVSTLDAGGLKRSQWDIDFQKDNLIVTFDGLFQDTNFVSELRSLLQVLQTEMRYPVDIEFAHDGSNLYLLQCRFQSYSQSFKAPAIPQNISPEKILFSADRYVTNGTVSGITHVVYVDPVRYGELETRADLLAVGQAVGKLNEVLPKRQFILMGPGRWGSRGDIRLGVSVTYSDINNTAMLIEIAKKQKGYMPELSFGTHFFQDLVEASIHYLPLYPDDPGVIFNEKLLMGATNIIEHLLPEFSFLKDTIRVVEVAEISPGRTLQVLMNAERDQAFAILTEHGTQRTPHPLVPSAGRYPDARSDVHWRWRLNRVEQLAAYLDPLRFGVKAMYVFGSTKNATSGPQSDIDLLIHFQGDETQKAELTAWLEGWSLSLSEENYLRTGYRTSGLLDVHFVSDEDIKNRSSFASKIGSITDPPRLLTLGRNAKK